jgi:NAD(P)H dehydrogenase (quinone)
LVTSWSTAIPSERRLGLALPISVIRSAPGSDSESHAARDHWIAQRVFDWSGVPTVHLRPTFFSEWLILPWVRDAIVDEGVINLPLAEGRHAPIAAEDQARRIANILADPNAHIGRTYTLHGPTELSQKRIAEAIGGVLGRTITYRPSTLETYRERLKNMAVRSS